ncbi:neprilysin-4-like isoform X2 [Danaus plexippus]|uniref:neprilysin-4-like isoform X2 n=1 Tax=Danaus plexippus TaxID=13037 RepID=UPI002AB1F5E3|nr:neprilysin-4-like isoform X2 [Danaus plexippus]
MARVDSTPQTVSIKPKSANFCRFIIIIVLTLFCAVAYFISRRPLDTLGDPSDQFTVKNIPNIYTRLESVDPEEREVFQGFQTSFLPPEEVVLSRKGFEDSDEVLDSNVTSDIFKWEEKRRENPTRVKRGSHSTFSTQDYDRETPTQNQQNVEDIQEDDDDGNEKEMVYGSDSDQHDEERNMQSVVHPEIYVDRGPLDDVEQVRRQPELEEGEMGSAAHLYKPVRSYTGVHAFWKGQGDKETIRHTQSKIMRQYMDAEADPCHDFYQYACGNWPTLNPIPADKAGYDTFEMLRENLDTVLKDMLEFSKDEEIPSQYPGPHLDFNDNLKHAINSQCSQESHDIVDYIITNSKEILNLTERKNTYDIKDESKTEIINRIRRYLDMKTRDMKKSSFKTKFKLHEYLFMNNKKGKNLRRPKRHSDNNDTRNQSEKKKRNIIYDKNGSNRETHFKRGKRKETLEQLLENLKQKYELPKNDPANGDAALKARFLFKSCMNHDILQKRGHVPLLDLLDILGGWPILKPGWDSKNFDWLELMAKLRLYNNDILISEWVGPDIKNSDEFVIQFDQTSLGLPTRDYFLQESNKVYLEGYRAYLIKIATLLGGNIEHVKESAVKLIDFEINLAKITSAPEDRRNVSELYRRMTLAKLEGLVPEIKWRKYLCIVMNRTIDSSETVVLFALSYVRAFRELLHMTDWIDEETKKLAAHKVDSMMLRIGYPDFILNKKELDDRYKEVQIHPDKYFENILNILQHLTKMEQSRIGQPVNKTLWNTAPAVVNAYYSRNKNQIMFPAGILQPPFYHRHFPRSLNFGGIGVVIGHEITHGFDDKGRLFDCEGNLHRWWSDSAIEAFHRRAQCLIDQYGRYVVPEVNMKLDGVNTQGENIADNGGVKQAFHAYQRWLLQHGAVDETLPELNHTSTQLFFLNFAQVWCGAMRPEAMRNKLKTAVHSPGRFRVIGTLSNSLDFAREFQCPPGSPMNPIHKCSVW